MTHSTIKVAALALLARSVVGHVGFWHPSMYGWNVTDNTFPYDNRPVTPLMYMNFDRWWWHQHQAYPPNAGDVFEWPAGGSADVQVACHKGYTDWWKQSEGMTDISIPEGLACGHGGPNTVHAASIDDVMGCGIAIVDKMNINDIKPEDFAIFTVKHQCPWFTHNQFQVPADMPACTGEYCHCAWFWIHSANSGGMQMFMNAFRCKVTNVKSTAKKIGKPKLARRCGADTQTPKAADPSNCTVGAKQPLYWLQNEGNNMFEGYYAAPFYNDLYDFKDGAQNDIFIDEAGNQVSSSTKPNPDQSVSKPKPETGNTSSNTNSGGSSLGGSTDTGKSTSSTSGSGGSSEGSTSSPQPNALSSTGETKQQVCKRRTAEQKRKRDLRRAAKVIKGHNQKKRGLASLFN